MALLYRFFSQYAGIVIYSISIITTSAIILSISKCPTSRLEDSAYGYKELVKLNDALQLFYIADGVAAVARNEDLRVIVEPNVEYIGINTNYLIGMKEKSSFSNRHRFFLIKNSSITPEWFGSLDDLKRTLADRKLAMPQLVRVGQ